MDKNNTIVEFSNVFKRLGQDEILSDISFVLSKGDSVALIGENGAGKTTIIRMLLGLLRCNDGKITVFGYPAWSLPNSIRSQIGVLLDHDGLNDNISIQHNLYFIGEIHGLSKSEIKSKMKEIFHRIRFDDDPQKLVSMLSKGNRQKIALARALLANPKLIVLDEPTANLDPLAQRDIRKMFQFLVEEKKTAVFLTSHNMSEVTSLNKNVIVLKKGEIVSSGPIDEMVKRQGLVIEIDLKNKEGIYGDLIHYFSHNGHWGRIEKLSSTKVQLFTKSNDNNVENISSILKNFGLDQALIAPRPVTLEEAYCEMMEDGTYHD